MNEARTVERRAAVARLAGARRADPKRSSALAASRRGDDAQPRVRAHQPVLRASDDPTDDQPCEAVRADRAGGGQPSGPPANGGARTHSERARSARVGERADLVRPLVARCVRARVDRAATMASHGSRRVAGDLHDPISSRLARPPSERGERSKHESRGPALRHLGDHHVQIVFFERRDRGVPSDDSSVTAVVLIRRRRRDQLRLVADDPSVDEKPRGGASCSPCATVRPVRSARGLARSRASPDPSRAPADHARSTRERGRSGIGRSRSAGSLRLHRDRATPLVSSGQSRRMGDLHPSTSTERSVALRGAPLRASSAWGVLSIE